MFRKVASPLLVAVAASLLLSPLAEAAGAKTVRHRPRHSSRVSAPVQTAPRSTAKRHTAKKHASSSAKKRRHSTKPR